MWQSVEFYLKKSNRKTEQKFSKVLHTKLQSCLKRGKIFWCAPKSPPNQIAWVYTTFTGVKAQYELF